MPRGYFNWTFHDVVKVLHARGFVQVGVEGSHYSFERTVEGKRYITGVAFHGNKTLKPRTIKSIIAQSGMPKKEWFR